MKQSIKKKSVLKRFSEKSLTKLDSKLVRGGQYTALIFRKVNDSNTQQTSGLGGIMRPK